MFGEIFALRTSKAEIRVKKESVVLKTYFTVTGLRKPQSIK